jgi:hypothetical protein
MLVFLRGKASERKLRLFEVACCRRMWNLLTDERSRTAVEVAERLADGLPTSSGPFRIEIEAMEAVTPPTTTARFAATIAAWVPFLSSGLRRYTSDRAREAAVAAVCAVRSYSHVFNDGSSCPPTFGKMAVVDDALFAAGAVPWEWPVQAALLRDIIGDPFRPSSLNPDWLTWHDGLLVAMAQRIYDSRDFSDMPVLADALEESGCSDQDILGHCRSGGEHVRGCWVLDLVLGKS